MPTRSQRLSTYSDYRSWPALAHRDWSARHLPSDAALRARLPEQLRVVDLFERTTVGDQPSPKSTLLFPHFAQWFVDGFLRTNPRNYKRNTSTHDIDLSQLYGQTVDVTRMLRLGSERQRGRLKCQRRNGQEFPPYYFDENGKAHKAFKDLEIVFPGSNDIPDLPGEDRKTGVPFEKFEDWQRNKLFALGIPRGNLHYGLTMMSTLFLREHNRIAGLIAAEKRRVGRRPGVRHDQEHADRDPAEDRHRGLHQPHHPRSVQVLRRTGHGRQREVVPTELDVGRVQHAVSLAHDDPRRDSPRRHGAQDQRRDVGHRCGDRHRTGCPFRRGVQSAVQCHGPVQHRSVPAQHRGEDHRDGAREQARLVQRLPQAMRLSQTQDVPRHLVEARSGRGAAGTATRTPTTSSCTSGCSPRMCGRTGYCRR